MTAHRGRQFVVGLPSPHLFDTMEARGDI